MTAPVVVGLDGSGRSLRALMWAAHDASLRGAPLRLVHVLTVSELSFPFARHEAAADRGGEILDEAHTLAGHAHPELEIAAEMPEGSGSAGFFDVSATSALLGRSDGAAVLVLGAKGHDLGTTMLGSVALQIAGHAACPVVVVGHMPVDHRVVVAGTDGSPDARAALAFAFEEAALRGFRLRVLVGAAVHHHAAPGTVEDVSEERLAELSRDLKGQLEPLRARFPAVTVDEQVVGKTPVEALAAASLRADLVVVGSRGRGGFHGLALGSVSHRVLHLAACPVAVVRAPREEAP